MGSGLSLQGGVNLVADFKPSQVTGDIATVDAPVSPSVVGAVTLVAAATLTTVATLVANGVNRVTKISCSGDDYAKFTLFINTVLKDTRRSGPERNTDFTFESPLTLTSGDVLDVKVEHFLTTDLLGFEATIYGFKEL